MERIILGAERQVIQPEPAAYRRRDRQHAAGGAGPVRRSRSSRAGWRSAYFSAPARARLRRAPRGQVALGGRAGEVVYGDASTRAESTSSAAAVARGMVRPVGMSPRSARSRSRPTVAAPHGASEMSARSFDLIGSEVRKIVTRPRRRAAQEIREARLAREGAARARGSSTGRLRGRWVTSTSSNALRSAPPAQTRPAGGVARGGGGDASSAAASSITSAGRSAAPPPASARDLAHQARLLRRPGSDASAATNLGIDHRRERARARADLGHERVSEEWPQGVSQRAFHRATRVSALRSMVTGFATQRRRWCAR